MYNYTLVDENYETHHYEATDMRAALKVHHMLVGTQAICVTRRVILINQIEEMTRE